MKITEALLAEHVVFHNLFDYVERATPKLRTLAEVRVLADLLDAMLESHGQIEDKLVMEPLDHCRFALTFQGAGAGAGRESLGVIWLVQSFDIGFGRRRRGGGSR
mgnify:CR=1 FL=1